MSNSEAKPDDKPFTAKFPLGHVVATPGALAALKKQHVSPNELLQRHITGDWGTLDPEDIRANEDALKEGERLLSNYLITPKCRIWIITERDRSVTTLLLPEEY